MNTGSKEALEFLQRVRPGGPWVLTAISPNPAPTETKTFTVFQTDDLVQWVEDRDGRKNIYWTVNALNRAATTKPSKEDVDSLLFLHVDVDPDKGKEIEVERKRILAKLKDFKPRPTIVLDSGGGYQAFWKLDEPLYVGGDPIRISDAEAYNQQLEVLLGGDHTHNCDRIMRLPGTTNIPNEKKRKAGRVEVKATVVWFDEGSYSLSDFIPAQRVQTGTSTSTAKGVQLSGNLPTVLIDDLPEQVTPRTRMLIVQGGDPDDPTHYASRSEVLFAVCCQLVRAGCSDDTIAAVILDPDYDISASVRAARRPVEYAARQIQRARENVVAPMLQVLNEKHAVIADLGGKCRIISEVMDSGMGRTRISKQSFEDFRNRYMHIKVEVGKNEKGEVQMKPAGHWWLNHPMRRQYTTMVFAPGREVEDSFNLWKGFACEAIPGKGHELYLEHMLQNICGGNQDHYDYLIRWLARAVQQPGSPGEVAVVLRGGQGTGKGTFIKEFGALWGRHFLQVAAAKHLVGNFNSHLRDCVVLFADEAFFAGDKQHEGVLKTLVTEETFIIEGKGVDAEAAANCTHLLMATNKDWAVPAGADERRFLVLDVGSGAKQDATYFAALRRAMANGGRESLLHYLMTIDLEEWEVRSVPKTEALKEQKLFSLGTEEQWWLERLTDGRTVASNAEWLTEVPKEKLQADYQRYCEGQRIMRRISPTALGRFLNRVLPHPWPRSAQRLANIEKTTADGRIELVKERAYWYSLPNLQVCRDEWDRLYGGSWAWPTEEDEPPRPQRAVGEPY